MNIFSVPEIYALIMKKRRRVMLREHLDKKLKNQINARNHVFLRVANDDGIHVARIKDLTYLETVAALNQIQQDPDLPSTEWSVRVVRATSSLALIR